MCSSKEQKEIYDYLREILGNDIIIIMNDRNVLYPKEIDIYIPELKLAIEYDSLYWHSEMGGKKNKVYHLNKTKHAIFNSIRLIHIFQTDWLYNKEIIKSILRNIVKKIDNRVYGRNCIIKEVDKVTADVFLFHNHLQGIDNSSIRLGLYYKDELISIMTFGKSRYDKKSQYEMYRYCNKINYTIIGGASKLFEYFVKLYNPTSIVSYSDRKYFDGLLYINLKFNFIHNTPPNYFYISPDYTYIKSRVAFQKHKLPKLLNIFDSTLTEWQNMKNNGFDRIWDCGNGKWLWKSNH